MMPRWFQRLNRRERVLSLLVAGTIFVLLNLVLWSMLLGAISRARGELALRKSARAEQVLYVKEGDLWRKRDAWLKQHQPALQSPVEASTLLDEVKRIGARHNLLIENPAIGAGESTANYQAVFASIETKSPWPPLVRFLYDVQKPESFVVFENVNLAIDSGDPTMMRGKFKIARWFAPGAKK